MLVSNFELTIYLREQLTYQDTTYELLITNLEDIEIRFLMEMHASISNLSYEHAILANLYVEILNADDVWQSPVYKDNLDFVRPIYFTIPSKATALIKINPPVEREVMGYITLRVPPVKNRSHYLITTQQSLPVKVLLAATRQDFCRSFAIDILDENRNPVYKTFINSWLSRQCIELASGKALNEIDPEGIGLTTKVADVLDYLQLSDDLKKQMISEIMVQEEDGNLR